MNGIRVAAPVMMAGVKTTGKGPDKGAYAWAAIWRKATLLLIICLLACLLTAQAAMAKSSVSIYAAASTTNAVIDIAAAFTETGKATVTTSFASSSTLAKQIENGAPADIYLSANPKWMDYLAERNMIEAATRYDLLTNRIVLIVPRSSSEVDLDIREGMNLAATLNGGRLAMGDPDHVPAGMYGKKALESLGIWASVADKLAPAKDVRAALALVARGESPLGLVYATDATISDKVAVIGMFPESSHPSITYPVAIVAGKRSASAEAFLEFLKGPEAASIFKQYGFAVK